MGGAEKSLISFLNLIDQKKLQENQAKLYLLLADQSGELTSQVPDYVELVSTPKSYRLFVTRLSDIIKENPLNVSDIIVKLYWKINAHLHLNKLSYNERYWDVNQKYIEPLMEEYDYVIAYMNGTATYYASQKVKSQNKYLWIHNEYQKLEYNNEFQRNFFDKANKIITISERCVESFLESFPEFEDKIQLIENISSKKVIELESKKFVPKELNGADFNIVSIGRLVEQKGYDLGIQAIKILCEKGIEVKWFILGEGDLKTVLENQILESGLADNVFLIGNRDNPYPYMKASDLFLQPSRFEGKSIALDEAKILCKPILVTNYSTVYDSIDNECNGLICDMNSLSIAEGIERMYFDTKLRNNLSGTLNTQNCSNEIELEKYYKLLGM